MDDILTVPFSPEEFVARTLAVMRRSYSEAVEFTQVLRLGDLEIDILNRHVRAGGTELHLTPLEQSPLYVLAANAGRLLTRDEILDYRWGCRLRGGKRCGRPPHPQPARCDLLLELSVAVTGDKLD